MSPAEDGLAARALAACLTIPTLSHPDPGRVDHASFQRLHDELRRWFPRLHEVWPRVYRFTPFRMATEQRAGIHGIEERIAVTDLRDGVAWYRRLMEDL